MVADREPEDDRRADQPAVGARVRRGPRAVVAADAVVPADEQPEQDRDQRQVEDVRVGVRADRPGERRQGERRGRPRPRGRPSASAPGRGRPSPPAATPRQTAESRFIRNAGVAERLEHAPRRASPAGRRSGSRSGARCPGPGRPSGTPRCPRTRRRAAARGARGRTPRRRPRGPAPGARGPFGDPVLRSDPPSTLVQEPFPVTGPASGGSERGTAAPSRSTGTQGAVGAVLVVLALGLALRLIIAYLLPGSGLHNDLGAFRFWAGELAAHGPLGLLRPRLPPRLHPGLHVRAVARGDRRPGSSAASASS